MRNGVVLWQKPWLGVIRPLPHHSVTVGFRSSYLIFLSLSVCNVGVTLLYFEDYED